MKYLLNCRSFISLMILFSFIDNFGMDDYIFNFKMDDYISNFKVVFVGDVGVGKTQIFNRIIKNTFFKEYNSSICADFSEKIINFNGENIKLELWDTSGQEKFRKLAKVFYKNSHLIVFVYAIDDKESFNNIKSWIEDVTTNTNEKPKFLLIGNKCDLEDKRQVSIVEAQQYAKTNNMEFIEVSAKDGFNIKIMFNSSLSELLKGVKKEENKFIENNSEFNNYKIINLQDDNNSQKKYHINKKDLPFCNKYCSCCPCLKKSEGDVEEQEEI